MQKHISSNRDLKHHSFNLDKFQLKSKFSFSLDFNMEIKWTSV